MRNVSEYCISEELLFSDGSACLSLRHDGVGRVCRSSALSCVHEDLISNYCKHVRLKVRHEGVELKGILSSKQTMNIRQETSMVLPESSKQSQLLRSCCSLDLDCKGLYRA